MRKLLELLAEFLDGIAPKAGPAPQPVRIRVDDRVDERPRRGPPR